MNHSIKLIIFAILAVTGSGLGSCKKDQPFMSNAQIIGFDLKECPCCGGTEIIIDNVANPNGSPYFLIGQIPANFKLGNNPKFPIRVKVDYKIDMAHCFGNYIDITRITTQ